MLGFVKDLVDGAGDLLGGVGGAITSASGLVGNIGSLWGGPQAGGILGLAAQIFGGTADDPWGLLDSPVFGNIVGAVGMELLRDDPAEVAAKSEAARMKAIRESSYGYTGAPGSGTRTRGLLTPPAMPKQATAARYLPKGRLV